MCLCHDMVFKARTNSNTERICTIFDNIPKANKTLFFNWCVSFARFNILQTHLWAKKYTTNSFTFATLLPWIITSYTIFDILPFIRSIDASILLDRLIFGLLLNHTGWMAFKIFTVVSIWIFKSCTVDVNEIYGILVSWPIWFGSNSLRKLTTRLRCRILLHDTTLLSNKYRTLYQTDHPNLSKIFKYGL